MNILQKASNQMAFFKCGVFGFQGAGKTFTASLIAIGLAKKLGIKEVAFMDTETGSDFVMPLFNKSGIGLLQAKRRSFSDLLKVIKECEDNGVQILLIDSITHVWRELMDTYDKKLNRRGRLQFQDWKVIKGEWQVYTDRFVNSHVHIIVCGRAGYDYDYDWNEDGSKDLVKTGTKMKAESEFGFEPSLVIEMESISQSEVELRGLKQRSQKQAFKPKVGSKRVHIAHVLKDRTNTINGQTFTYTGGIDEDQIISDFCPHLDALNIGGKHLGVDTSSDSADRFDINGKPEWKLESEERKIYLDIIKEYMVAVWPGRKEEDVQAKSDFLEIVFGNRSWKFIEERIEQKELKDASERIKNFPSIFKAVRAENEDESKHTIISMAWEKTAEIEEPDIPISPERVGEILDSAITKEQAAELKKLAANCNQAPLDDALSYLPTPFSNWIELEQAKFEAVKTILTKNQKGKGK